MSSKLHDIRDVISPLPGLVYLEQFNGSYDATKFSLESGVESYTQDGAYQAIELASDNSLKLLDSTLTDRNKWSISFRVKDLGTSGDYLYLLCGATATGAADAVVHSGEDVTVNGESVVHTTPAAFEIKYNKTSNQFEVIDTQGRVSTISAGIDFSEFTPVIFVYDRGDFSIFVGGEQYRVIETLGLSTKEDLYINYAPSLGEHSTLAVSQFRYSILPLPLIHQTFVEAEALDYIETVEYLTSSLEELFAAIVEDFSNKPQDLWLVLSNGAIGDVADGGVRQLKAIKIHSSDVFKPASSTTFKIVGGYVIGPDDVGFTFNRVSVVDKEEDHSKCYAEKILATPITIKENRVYNITITYSVNS